MALCGNIDCGLLHFGPKEKIYELTRKTLEVCRPGGGFVLGTSNAVFQETPKEHYAEMIRAWHGVRSLLTNCAAKTQRGKDTQRKQERYCGEDSDRCTDVVGAE